MLMQPSNSYEWDVSNRSSVRTNATKKSSKFSILNWLDGVLQFACPWPAHSGSSSVNHLKHPHTAASRSDRDFAGTA
jgi:hypothetical protein